MILTGFSKNIENLIRVDDFKFFLVDLLAVEVFKKRSKQNNLRPVKL